jgi:RNA polymerase sigma factor for flagellar operon FliA
MMDACSWASDISPSFWNPYRGVLLKQISLTREDLSKLWREYKELQSPNARATIITHYLGLVRFIAGRMVLNAPAHVEEDDLLSWGILGLLDAVEKFDLEQKVNFETYASTRIRGAIIDQMRSLDWAPRSLRRKAREMGEASAKLRKELSREPTESELAGGMGMTEDELFELKTEIHGTYIVSLDATVSNESEADETTLGQMTSDASSPSPEAFVTRKETEQQLVKAIGRLETNERQVITLYYYDELTLKEIGEVLALSESRICQIHRAAVRKLKQYLKVNLRDAIY